MLQQIEQPRVYLTFDDGPDPEYTPRLLELLASYNCKATFFLVGTHALRHPALVKRISNDGHNLGNHTYSHLRPRASNGGEDIRQVRLCQQILEDIAGYKPLWFRPPFGQLTPSLEQEARRLGLTTVLWNRSAIDWGLLGTRRGIARRLRKTRPGDILLLHDARRRHNHPDRMLAVLPGFLCRLREHHIMAAGLDEHR